MRNILPILIMIQFVFIQVAFGQITFQKTYGGGGTDIGYSVQQLSDEGYIVTGKTNSFLETEGGIYLIRTNALGDTLWTRTYGGTNNWEDAASVQQTKDGGFIMAGGAYSFGNGLEDAYVVKVDSAGSLQWSVTIGGSSDDRVNWIEQTKEGNYIIAGTTASFGAGANDVYLILLDSSGGLIWTKTFGGSSNDEGKVVKQTHDSGFIILSETFVGSQSKLLLIKTDRVGIPVWSKLLDGTYGNGLFETNDGSFVITGGIRLDTINRIFLYKLNNDGGLLWAKTFDGSAGNAVLQATDGGYLILSEEAGLIRTDSLGVVEWAKKYFNGVEQSLGNNMCLTKDNGCIITGSKYVAGSELDILLLKTDSSGNSGCTDLTENPNASDFIPQITDQTISISSGGSSIIPATKVNKVSTSVQTWTLPIAGFTYNNDTTLTVTFYKSSFNDLKWHWDFGDGNVDSTHSIVSHAYADTGYYNVCLTAINNCGSDLFCRIITIQKPGGVEERNPAKFKIYPNPAKDKVFIEFSDLNASDHSISIYNSLGSQVYGKDQIKDNILKIERNLLPTGGIYFIRITDDKGSAGSAKLIFD